MRAVATQAYTRRVGGGEPCDGLPSPLAPTSRRDAVEPWNPENSGLEAGLAAGLRDEPDLADHHRLVDGLEHVVEGQRGGGDGGERLHLDAGLRARPHARASMSIAAAPAARCRRATWVSAQRMAERDQRRRPLGGHDAGEPRGLRADRPSSPALRAPAGAPPAFTRMWPAATASRAVTGLAPTSTMRTRPAASTCDRARASYAPACAVASARARKNDRLSSDTVRSTLFSFTSSGTVQRARREVEDRLHAGGRPRGSPRAARPRRARRSTAMPMRSWRTMRFNCADVVDGDAACETVADLLVEHVEEGDDLEAFLPEAGVVGEREAEVAGAHDGHAEAPVEAEDLPQVPAEILHVVADAADAELAEVGEVLADLGGVQVELLGEALRRHGLARRRARAR